MTSSYLKISAGEFLLLLLSTWSLSVVGFNGFFLDSLLIDGGYAMRAGLALVVCAILLIVLYVAASGKNRRIVGGVIYFGLAAVIVIVALGMSVGEDLYVDEEGNYLYLALVLIAANTAGFLLTRTLTGSAVWFIACAFLCSVIQAFYESGEIVMSALAALSSLALIVYRNFRLGLVGADVARHPAYVGSFVSSIVPVMAAGVAALLVWFAIIAPLEPGVVDVKFLTDYRQLPIEQLKGTADENPVLNYDYTSENLIDGFYYTTDDLIEDPDSETVVDADAVLRQMMSQQPDQESQNSSQSQINSGSGGGTQDELDKDSTEEMWNGLSWSEIFPWVILWIVLAILVILAIIAYFVGRRVLRRHRLVSMLSLPARSQVESIYLFLLGRLKRLGFSVPDGSTLSDWSFSQARAMDMLTEETRVGFDDLTHIYYDCVYGHYVPTEDNIVPFVAYYVRFWKAARTHLGNFRYFFKSFRL